MIDFKKYVKESHREDLLKLIKKHAKDGETKLSLRQMADGMNEMEDRKKASKFSRKTISYQWVKIVLSELEALGEIEVKRGVKTKHIIKVL